MELVKIDNENCDRQNMDMNLFSQMSLKSEQLKYL